MSFFHTHDLEFIGKTYAPPSHEAHYYIYSDAKEEAKQRYLLGCTTYLWKCSDPNCDKIVKTIALGKQDKG